MYYLLHTARKEKRKEDEGRFQQVHSPAVTVAHVKLAGAIRLPNKLTDLDHDNSAVMSMKSMG